MPKSHEVEPTDAILRRRVIERREALGIEARPLSRKIGLSDNALGQWEKGETKDMKVPYLPALARELQTTIGWLLGVDDDATKAVNAAHQRENAALDAVARIEKLLSLFAYASTAQTHVQDGIIGAIQNYLAATGVKLDRTLVRLSRGKHDG